MKKQRYIVLIFVLLTNILNVVAQQGGIRGFVYEKTSGEPIAFATIYVYGTNQGAVTDINGFFIVNKLEKGTILCLFY